ncbi:MAG: hypothetical protein J7M03_07805 [Candidatus Desulfofervidaceae bacterium]|nr:hypothetical protein [Candidatus Desulfofervidaceae bacterium]MDL1969887.1 hypothetical protein [Candidatus Desulfofervidaceae bacterium]
MPTARLLGILIVFGIVFMVTGGAIWDFTESWRVVFIGEIITALLLIPPVIIHARRAK